MVFVPGAADLVDLAQHRGDFVGVALMALHVVQRPGQRPFGARPVVPDHVDNQGVLAQPHQLHRVDDAADLRVYVLKETGKDLLHPGVHAALVIGAVVPGRDGVRAGRQLFTGRDHAQLFLPLPGQPSLLVPAVPEAARVLVRPLLRHMMRGVGTRWIAP